MVLLPLLMCCSIAGKLNLSKLPVTIGPLNGLEWKGPLLLLGSCLFLSQQIYKQTEQQKNLPAHVLGPACCVDAGLEGLSPAVVVKCLFSFIYLLLYFNMQHSHPHSPLTFHHLVKLSWKWCQPYLQIGTGRGAVCAV